MNATRNELAAAAADLIPLAARKLRPPPGLNVEDLESAGNEALVEAATRFDPTAGVPWKNYAYHRIKLAMRKVISSHRRRPTAALQPVIDGDEMPPPIDVRSSDPAELASVREAIRGRQGHPSTRKLQGLLPSPGEVAERVTALRSAMFGAISEQDVADVMGTVVRQAKAGDLKAAKLLADLLAPGRSGVTVHQQAVVIRTGDLD